jgi:hypothetical protein
MSGATNLRGLAGYQQRYLTFRVLSALGMRSLGQESTGPVLRAFSIEGRTSENAPCWDVRLEFTDDTVELEECKDTEITRADRLIFYDRLREEIASGTPAERITPAWVTDDRKQSPNMLASLGGIPAAIENLDLAGVARVLPDRVLNTNHAIQEAVYQLCHYTGEEDTEEGNEGGRKKTKRVPRPCTVEEAKALLIRLRIARHRFQDLDQSVKLLVTGAFTSGSADAVYKFITGVLTDDIVTKGEARFTIDTFVEAVGTTALARDVEGRVRHLLSFNAASGFTEPIRLVRWTRLPGAPTTRWGLAERVPEYSPARSCLIVAGMGVGKTVTSQMAFEEEARRRHPARVLRLEARALDREDLAAAVRLACLLCGVGSTWLAIDGLDEVPHGLRPDWERALHALTVLPTLTLLITIRREVLAAREWLATITAMLAPVEMCLLETGQVEGAFAGAGLRVPANPRLIQALQNPFLLSLYADVVTPGDMPLAESGEATAFLVIDEFWKRRVRGVSEGQRAVGESEASQEPKWRAAVFLGDRMLAGDLAVSRAAADAQVNAGLEMLLREGVIREQGAGAVAWIHEWLREYALVDQLLSRCEVPSAVTLARRIAADCPIDHVARAAAAGGVKWVVANPAAGTPAVFISELWSRAPGLAREALAILLEGPPSALALGDLADDILVEAVTLAVHLRATQWGADVARLADGRFFGPLGDKLHDITVQYELTVAPGPGEPAGDTVRRLVDRDLRRQNAGRGTLLRTFATLMEKIVVTASFRDVTVQSWLVALSGTVNEFSFGTFRDALSGILAAGEVGTAYAMFRSAVGLANAARGDRIADAVVRRRFAYEGDLITILSTDRLLTDNVATWGDAAVAFLAELVEAKQRHAWPSTRRSLAALGAALPDDAPFEADIDQDPRVTTLDADQDGPIVRVAAVVSNALQELAQRDDPSAFRDLADRAVRAQFAALVVLPLLVLYDAASGGLPGKAWHAAETVRLLSDDNVANLHSLHDVRRLLRRCLPPTLDQASKEAVVGAIRRAGLPEGVRIRELADLRAWGLLTREEAEEADRAAADKIDDPPDSRNERLFGIERGSPPTRPETGTGWPHPEDEDRIHLLQRSETEPEGPVPDSPAPTPLARRLEALSVVLGRSEATSEEWAGRILGWCHRAIEQLRRTVEREEDEDRGRAAQQ